MERVLPCPFRSKAGPDGEGFFAWWYLEKAAEKLERIGSRGGVGERRFTGQSGSMVQR